MADTGAYSVLPTVPEPEPFVMPLTGHDRCDVGNCGAQAYVRVTFRTGTLLFCGHHYAIQPHGVQRDSVAIHDERSRLSADRLDVSA